MRLEWRLCWEVYLLARDIRKNDREGDVKHADIQKRGFIEFCVGKMEEGYKLPRKIVRYKDRYESELEGH